jgi:DNA gyrase/topoisomerase IV subunit A
MKVTKSPYSELVETYDDLYQATVCKERQLPDIRDGMRIVQRRLYWVFLKMSKEKRYKLNKSASIVGETIKYHCHGDCLHPDTLFYTLDGVTMSIKEMHESKNKEFWVLSFDDKEKRYKPNKLEHPRIGQKSYKNYEIIMSDGSTIECTPNHPFLVYNKDEDLIWKKAEDIKELDYFASGTIKNPNLVIMASVCIYVKKIIVKNYENGIDMYDFTVKGDENALIVTEKTGNLYTYFISHNSSIYDSLVNEVNSVSNLLKGKGNWGCKSSSLPSKPAKMRYTEVALLKRSESFFKYAPYAIMVDGENNEKEPQYIPVPAPLSLLGGFYGISKAGKAYIPPYKLSDLTKRLKWLISDSKNGKGPIIKPYFGLKLEMSGDFEGVLTNGSGDIDVYPLLDINEKKEEIVVRGYCPELTALGKKLEKMSESDKYGKYIDIVDLSSKKDEIIVSYKTKYMKNVDLSFKSLCEYVKKELTHTLRCKIITYKGLRDFPVMSVDAWLLDNFNQLKFFRQKELETEITSLEDKVKLNEAIMIIRPLIQEYLNKYKVFTNVIIEELKLKSLFLLNDDKDLCSKVFQISVLRLLDCQIDNESIIKKINLLKSMINETSIKENLLIWMDELSKEFKE